MCGILGEFVAKGGGRAPLLDARHLDLLRHRGPDHQGWFVDRDLVMGFRRLSIIDTAGGHQPFYDEDERVVLTVNGEIYNHRRLRDDLERDGAHRFRSRSDGETLAHLYQDLGQDFLSPVHGMYALALFDRPRRRLVLARDRAGKKPLYWRWQDGRLQWSSELRALIADKRPAIDRDALDDYLRFGYIPAPLTPYHGIRKLPAAHLLTLVEGGEPRVQRYWSLVWKPDFAPMPAPGARKEWAELLTKHLDRAVGRRLESEVPLAFLLSGGVDSSAVFASGARQAGPGVRPMAFTISVDDQEVDEAELAALTASRYHATHQVARVAAASATDLVETVNKVEEPVSTDALLPTDRVFQEVARAGIVTVLSGEGADEIFAGYGKFGHADRNPPFPSAGPLDRYLASEEFCFPGLHERQALLGPVEPHDRFRWLEDEVRDLDPLGRMLAIETSLRLPDRINLRLDRLSMAWSVEARAPFMDHELMQFAAALPRPLLRHDGVAKWILRQAVADRLPPGVIQGRKAPFRVPDRWFLDNPDLSWLLEPAHVVECGLVRPEEVIRLRERGLEDRPTRERLFNLLVLHLWFRCCYEDDLPIRLENNQGADAAANPTVTQSGDPPC